MGSERPPGQKVGKKQTTQVVEMYSENSFLLKYCNNGLEFKEKELEFKRKEIELEKKELELERTKIELESEKVILTEVVERVKHKKISFYVFLFVFLTFVIMFAVSLVINGFKINSTSSLFLIEADYDFCWFYI